uniref:Uncharacterized protein n=1 Tax=Rhizophora mucronata TaxID=61149 RepID=A0A2P2PA24_RHIMU
MHGLKNLSYIYLLTLLKLLKLFLPNMCFQGKYAGLHTLDIRDQSCQWGNKYNHTIL